MGIIFIIAAVYLQTCTPKEIKKSNPIYHWFNFIYLLIIGINSILTESLAIFSLLLAVFFISNIVIALFSGIVHWRRDEPFKKYYSKEKENIYLIYRKNNPMGYWTFIIMYMIFGGMTMLMYFTGK